MGWRSGQGGGAGARKLKAKPVEPGDYDLVLDPTNLWLTIHESVGHPTELDRALGWEANFAGTTFCTPDKLGKLQYGSELMNIVADRSQEGGLSTVGYDDDGVRSVGTEFPIIKDGVFVNYQSAIGQAQLIGQKRSNGCAFADSWQSFPIQRMPNVSLQPNPKKCSLHNLFSGVERGIYIVGNGSWSIDQQRHNFPVRRPAFLRDSSNGKLGGMLRDVAYQGSTVGVLELDGWHRRQEHLFSWRRAELRQGPTRADGSRLARRGAGTIPSSCGFKYGTKGHHVILSEADAREHHE